MSHTETLPLFLKKRAFLTPDRTALVFQDQRLTFKELYELAIDMCGRLTSVGLKKNQFVGVLLNNHLNTVVIIFALQLLGVKAVMLNTRLTAEELNFQITDSGAAFVVSESSFSTMTSQLHTTVISKEVLSSIEALEANTPIDEVALDEVCTIMYTSGTSGSPKGVMQTYGNHWWSVMGSALNLGLREGDAWLCAVPLFHISGYSILMRSVIYGMKVILHTSFDVEKTIHDIHFERVSTMSVVSIMLQRLVEKLEKPLPAHFRCMLLGGGPAPLPLLERCLELDVPVFQTYGMTETASQIVTLAPEYSVSKLGSAGKPLFPAQLKILQRDGNECESLQSGEIAVKGAMVTKGYLGREAGSHVNADGWFLTGDIGYVDHEGFLFVQDRRSDLIISGGENIYPAEIEGALLAHPAVAEVGVVGMEDQEWGQVPVAYIVLKDDLVQAEALKEHCLERLAKYKVPRRFIFVKELPRNAANKLLRRELKTMLEAEEN